MRAAFGKTAPKLKPLVIKIYLHNKQQENTDPNQVVYRSEEKMCPKGSTIFLEECIQNSEGYIYSAIIDIEAFTDLLYRYCIYK